MNNRRIYVSISELNYRGLRRLGVYTGECAGMIAARLINQYVAHHELTDDSFNRWIQAEHRDIEFGSPPPPDIRHLHNKYRRSGADLDRDDDEWPRSPQDHDERPQ
jgi:hypothetical protein